MDMKFNQVNGTELKLLGSLKLKETHLTSVNNLITYTDIILGENNSEKFNLYKCHENEPVFENLVLI